MDDRLPKRFLPLHCIGAECVICCMDIHSDIGYTVHGDSSLFVVIPALLGVFLVLYDGYILVLLVLGSLHIIWGSGRNGTSRKNSEPMRISTLAN